MKQIFFEVFQAFLWLVRSFFSFINGGEKCIICNSFTHVLPVCKACRAKYFDVSSTLSVKRCKKCGRVNSSVEDLCLQCRENIVLLHTDKVMPLYDYLLWNKEIMFLWKINGIRSLSGFFAEKIAEVLREMGIQVIVPVPPRPGKIQKKGWDQIDELCKFLEFRFGFKVLKLLQRTTTQQQKKLNRENRLEKIGSAYVLKSEKEQLKALKLFHGFLPEHVCIIDDVSTTGATLEKCAELLKNRGVKKVDAVTLFVV